MVILGNLLILSYHQGTPPGIHEKEKGLLLSFLGTVLCAGECIRTDIIVAQRRAIPPPLLLIFTSMESVENASVGGS